MSICRNIKQKFNEARVRGEKELILKKKETTEQQLEELRECGYIVREINNKIIIKE